MPQLMPGGILGQSSSNLKLIQPRPTLLPEPTPNLSLDELRRSKKDLKNKHKKDLNSPGNSPPRSSTGNGNPSANLHQSLSHIQSQPTNLSSASLPAIGLPHSSMDGGGAADIPAKSPAYSDIS